jgi:hypothetical protein
LNEREKGGMAFLTFTPKQEKEAIPDETESESITILAQYTIQSFSPKSDIESWQASRF